MVCRIANYLKSIGVKKGDDVTIYMPMVVELPAAMVSILICFVEHLCTLVSFFALMSSYITLLCSNTAKHACVSSKASVLTCSWRVLALVQSTQLCLPASQQSHWQGAFVTQSQM